MAHRKALTPDQWKERLSLIVSKASKEFGQLPCVGLEPDDDCGAELIACRINSKKETVTCNGYGRLIETQSDCLSVHVLAEDIPVVIRLLREYTQPDPDFDANLDYWSRWEESDSQASLNRWLC